jgi:hypothetical protein
MERERAQYHAQVIGNALLVAAAVLFVLGAAAIGWIVEDIAPLFGGDPFDNEASLKDYIRASIVYVFPLLTSVAILTVGGLCFRWLAVEQDARMVEFDILLDALGVPVDDDEDEGREETTPDA